jgi:hypothetical protein
MPLSLAWIDERLVLARMKKLLGEGAAVERT